MMWACTALRRLQHMQVRAMLLKHEAELQVPIMLVRMGKEVIHPSCVIARTVTCKRCWSSSMTSADSSWNLR
jgi:hypothetical protein